MVRSGSISGSSGGTSGMKNLEYGEDKDEQKKSILVVQLPGQRTWS